MKSEQPQINTSNPSRDALRHWYQTPFGQMLRQIEARYLARAINVTYKQLILQIGSVGWEQSYLDDGRYNTFFSADKTLFQKHNPIRSIVTDIHDLPLANESIDLVIMPHTLEFATDQQLLLQEVERILKPEGQLLVLGFNPWSIYRLYHILTGKRKAVPWCGKFIGRHKLLDWLDHMNFQTDITTGFYLKPATSVADFFEKRHASTLCIAYAVRAIKRRYTLTPLKPAWKRRPQFVPGDAIEPTATFGWELTSRSSRTHHRGNRQ